MMKQLKRSECAILPLVLKGKWYDMIASGEKREEYRDFKPYWQKRIVKWSHEAQIISKDPKAQVVAFSRGYKKADMFFTVFGVTLLTRYYYRPLTSKWGEPETPHFIILLGERVELVLP